jgi:hypothetical protein
MTNANSSDIELRLRKSPDEAGRRDTESPILLPRPKSAAGAFYFLLLMPGLLVCMAARGAYPLLDDRVALGIMLSLFLGPVALQILSFFRKSAGDGMLQALRAVYFAAGYALVALAIVVCLNGWLDKSPTTLMEAQVVRKVAAMGRREAQNTLVVSSWRPGRREEYLNVSGKLLRHAVVGRNVLIEVHGGKFGWPWAGVISPE